MKGFVEEIFGFLIIVVVIMLVGLFFVSSGTSKNLDLLKMKKGTVQSQEADSMIMSLYDTKLQGFDKSYAEILVDACLQGHNKTQVYYGKNLGTIDVNELITPMINSRFGVNRWALEVVTKNGNATYGIKANKTFVYDYSVPIPYSTDKGNTNRIIMYLK
jgi:hypothetical protein